MISADPKKSIKTYEKKITGQEEEKEKLMCLFSGIVKCESQI